MFFAWSIICRPTRNEWFNKSIFTYIHNELNVISQQFNKLTIISSKPNCKWLDRFLCGFDAFRRILLVTCPCWLLKLKNFLSKIISLASYSSLCDSLGLGGVDASSEEPPSELVSFCTAYTFFSFFLVFLKILQNLSGTELLMDLPEVLDTLGITLEVPPSCSSFRFLNLVMDFNPGPTLASTTWPQWRLLPGGRRLNRFTNKTQALQISPLRGISSWKHWIKSCSYFFESVKRELKCVEIRN